jgi:hypothetical protein
MIATMHSHRLRRLTRLTQGVALIGLGLGKVGCATEPPHVNAPYSEADAGGLASPAADPIDAGAPLTPALARDADARADAATPAAPLSHVPPVAPTGTTTPAPGPKVPHYTNAPYSAPPSTRAPTK